MFENSIARMKKQHVLTLTLDTPGVGLLPDFFQFLMSHFLKKNSVGLSGGWAK